MTMGMECKKKSRGLVSDDFISFSTRYKSTIHHRADPGVVSGDLQNSRQRGAACHVSPRPALPLAGRSCFPFERLSRATRVSLAAAIRRDGVGDPSLILRDRHLKHVD